LDEAGCRTASNAGRPIPWGGRSTVFEKFALRQEAGGTDLDSGLGEVFSS
jgi:hypothetical protein